MSDKVKETTTAVIDQNGTTAEVTPVVTKEIELPKDPVAKPKAEKKDFDLGSIANDIKEIKFQASSNGQSLTTILGEVTKPAETTEPVEDKLTARIENIEKVLVLLAKKLGVAVTQQPEKTWTYFKTKTGFKGRSNKGIEIHFDDEHSNIFKRYINDEKFIEWKQANTKEGK